jgi:hypothetical protein
VTVIVFVVVNVVVVVVVVDHAYITQPTLK